MNSKPLDSLGPQANFNLLSNYVSVGIHFADLSNCEYKYFSGVKGKSKINTNFSVFMNIPFEFNLYLLKLDLCNVSQAFLSTYGNYLSIIVIS